MDSRQIKEILKLIGFIACVIVVPVAFVMSSSWFIMIVWNTEIALWLGLPTINMVKAMIVLLFVVLILLFLLK